MRTPSLHDITHDKLVDTLILERRGFEQDRQLRLTSESLINCYTTNELLMSYYNTVIY